MRFSGNNNKNMLQVENVIVQILYEQRMSENRERKRENKEQESSCTRNTIIISFLIVQ